jgi:hypothetical protein
MVSVLLLTSFVTNAYAAEDFPTSDLGSGEFNEAKITLSDFPGQTGESVTDVDLTPSPCSAQNDATCTGFSDITIPGIGDGNLLVILQNHHQAKGQSELPKIVVYLVVSCVLASYSSGPDVCVHMPVLLAHHTTFFNTGNKAVSRDINIPDIGTGQVTIQLS